MNYGDYEKSAFLGWLLGNRPNANQPEEDEMHCCDNCRKYEFNDGDCTGWGIDSAEDNHCSYFVAISR
jgi:hypothetical protein